MQHSAWLQGVKREGAASEPEPLKSGTDRVTVKNVDGARRVRTLNPLFFLQRSDPYACRARIPLPLLRMVS